MSTQVLAAYGLDGLPVALALASLFVIVLVRSHVTYWLGRGVEHGARRRLARRDGAGRGPHPPLADAPGRGPDPDPATSDALPGVAGWWPRTVARAARAADGPAARYGVALVHRWGPPAVTLAYLTVGVQTAVFAGAGLVRMPYLRFTVASVPGAAMWAVVWGTVGMGAVWAALTLGAASPAGLVALAVGVVAVVVVVRRRRRRTASTHAGDLARADDPA